MAMISVAGAPLSDRIYKICTLLSTGFVENLTPLYRRKVLEALCGAALRPIPGGFPVFGPVTLGPTPVRMKQ
jgi:hypothetical protein